jgi:hypothetical protein
MVKGKHVSVQDQSDVFDYISQEPEFQQSHQRLLPNSLSAHPLKYLFPTSSKISSSSPGVSLLRSVL